MRNLILLALAAAILAGLAGCGAGTDPDAGKVSKDTVGNSPTLPSQPKGGPSLD